METPHFESLESPENRNAYASYLLIREKMDATDVCSALIEKGVDEDTAWQTIEAIEQQIHEAKKSQANNDILFGALWCFGGIIVTAVTYSEAATSGGTYVIAWGAILFGGIQFIKGLANVV